MFGAMRLKLYHQAGGSLEPRLAQAVTDLDGVPLFKWQTCLRSLVLVPDDYADDIRSSGPSGEHTGENIGEYTGEWLEGESAYRRLLEIACGLHSPLVGETEVFGQFKDAIQARLEHSAETDGVEAAFVATLRQWAKALIEDVKMIRQKHLLDLGSQSYGSLVRREVRDLACPHIEFLGAGQLACEILPWLMKALNAQEVAEALAPSVTVHARDLVKARARLAASATGATSLVSSLRFMNLENGPVDLASKATRVLIIAAPMKAQDVAAWIRDRVHYDLVIDLRGESRLDSLQGWAVTSRLRSLEEIFSSIESAREVASTKKNAALGLIEKRVEVRGATATHRPFGWDDVWS